MARSKQQKVQKEIDSITGAKKPTHVPSEYRRFVRVDELTLGDVIIERGDRGTIVHRTHITKLGPCGGATRLQTHVNGQDCYENFYEVEVR
jgi:hypothetical protein